MVAVIIDNFGPGSLGEDLHHDVLWVDEGLEIVKFWELVVRWGGVSVFLGRVKKLHTEDAKNKEEEGKKQKKPSDDWKYLSKGLEQPPKFEDKLIIPLPDSLAHYRRSKQKGHSEHPVDDE